VRNGWWLRTIGAKKYMATYVSGNGQISTGGTYCFNDQPDKPKDYIGVRPVIHLDISNTDVWTYAGRVTSEDVIEESPSPSPSPEVVGDLWLGFMIDQKEIYTNTTHLTGSMTPCRDCIMIISCGKDVIRTIKLDENKGTLDFDVDFSGYKAGSDVCIELKFVGEQEPPIYIWETSQKLHYTLMEPGQTPAPSTPEPSLSPESTYEPRKAF
jgi:hypothetical protein